MTLPFTLMSDLSLEQHPHCLPSSRSSWKCDEKLTQNAYIDLRPVAIASVRIEPCKNDFDLETDPCLILHVLDKYPEGSRRAARVMNVREAKKCV